MHYKGIYLTQKFRIPYRIYISLHNWHNHHTAPEYPLVFFVCNASQKNADNTLPNRVTAPSLSKDIKVFIPSPANY